MFGYATNTGIDIGRLGAERSDNCVHPVDVVWTATRPKGGRVVVGWYRDAKVYRALQRGHRGPRMSFWNIESDEKDSRRLEVEERTLVVEAMREGGYPARRTWFADEYEYGKEVRLQVERLFAEHPLNEEFDRRKLEAAAEQWRKSFEPPSRPETGGKQGAEQQNVANQGLWPFSRSLCLGQGSSSRKARTLRQKVIQNGKWPAVLGGSPCSATCGKRAGCAPQHCCAVSKLPPKGPLRRKKRGDPEAAKGKSEAPLVFLEVLPFPWKNDASRRAGSVNLRFVMPSSGAP